MRHDDFFTVSQAATSAGVTTQSVRLWIAAGLPVYRRKSGPYLIRPADLTRWMTPVRVQPQIRPGSGGLS